jgi:hypothetical protein
MSSLINRVTDAVDAVSLPPIIGWEAAADVTLRQALSGLDLPNAHLFIVSALDTAGDFIA